jgi:hypothetical protein
MRLLAVPLYFATWKKVYGCDVVQMNGRVILDAAPP